MARTLHRGAPRISGSRHTGERVRIGIDAGTGEVRVVAHRAADGRVLARADAPFAVHADGERRTVDFMSVAAAMDGALRRILEVLGSTATVEGIGIAATASTVAVVGSAGDPRGDGLLWADHRARAEARRLREAGHPSLDRMLGHVSPEWGIAKLAHLAGTGALAARGADRVVELADWLAWRLSGTWAANAGTREWGWAGGDDGAVPAALLEGAGVDGSFAARVIPDVRRTGEVLGAVTSRSWRGTPLDGARVLVGGMDSYLAATGMGAAAPGRLCVSVGSSSAVIGGAACGDATGRLFGPLRTVLPGGEAAWHGGQTTAGLAAAWAAHILGASTARLEREAAAVPPGARGVVFRETLLDRRTPSPRAPMTGGWSGIDIATTRGELYRAVLEGVALGLGESCRTLAPAEVVATGGMLRSGVFAQALADVLARPVRRLRDVPSAAALGAAFADRPGDIAAFRRAALTVAPSGADYAEARARYLAADTEPSGRGAA